MLEDDYLKMELPALSKKAAVFRFDDSKDIDVDITDHAIKIFDYYIK